MSPLTGLRLGSLLLTAFSATLVVYAIASGQTALSRYHARYVAHLNGTLRVLFRPESGQKIVMVQGAVALLLIASNILTDLPTMLPMWLLVVGVIPPFYLLHLRGKRLALLEDQVDGFVLALANAMKTVPSAANALQATTMVLPQPTREEVERVLKEMRVGSTLEDALLAMSARIKSRWVDVALSAVLVGLRVGGNLPSVLERTATMLREINRVLGVVRAKTAEARIQLLVLAVFPLVIVFVFNLVRPGYFEPLQNTFVGHLCIGVAVSLWLASLALGWKIMQVDV